MRSIVVLLALGAGLFAQQKPFSGAAEIKQSLEKLNVVGSVLMIAAHPDDENTGVIAYLVAQWRLYVRVLDVYQTCHDRNDNTAPA